MNFVGIWHITEMEMWDEDYFNMELQAYIRVKENGLGDFQFGLVSGGIDGEVVDFADQKRFEFTWDGSDELDPVSGGGWLHLVDDTHLEGMIKIHLGDDSMFKAEKAG